METTPQVIFFLNLGPLPRWYMYLAESFQDYNLQIVPIKPDQLKSLAVQYKQAHIIAATTNFKERKVLSNVLHRYLGWALKTGKFSFYHLSSFQQLFDYGFLKKRRLYSYYSLPIDIEEVTLEIAKNYYSKNKLKDKWPGGKKVGLPLDSMG